MGWRTGTSGQTIFHNTTRGRKIQKYRKEGSSDGRNDGISESRSKKRERSELRKRRSCGVAAGSHPSARRLTYEVVKAKQFVARDVADAPDRKVHLEATQGKQDRRGKNKVRSSLCSSPSAAQRAIHYTAAVCTLVRAFFAHGNRMIPAIVGNNSGHLKAHASICGCLQGYSKMDRRTIDWKTDMCR